MRIETNRHGAVTVVVPMGPIQTEEDAIQLRTESLEVLGKTLGRFVIDVSEMTFVNSFGLEALVDVTLELGASGQSLKLCGISDTLREIITITDQTSKFQQFEDVQTAVRSFL
ncbi:MAG: STAS domain-containing protein [Phycisphaerales bacterium]|nr:STAS domain-containing protein [Phycisphaerales bacterium]